MLAIRSYRGIELGLGQTDPGAAIAARLEAEHPGHLILVQADKFLHGYDRSAYVLATLKDYKLKLVGTAEALHLRVGFPAGNFKRRLWSMVAEFGIPYATECALTHSRSASFMRDCQPLPVALNADRVALSTRKAICVLSDPAGRPRRRLTSARMASAMSGASGSSGAVSASCRAKAKSERDSPRSRAAHMSASVMEVIGKPVMINLPFVSVRRAKADDAMRGSGRVNHQQDMQNLEHIGKGGNPHFIATRGWHIETVRTLQHQIGIDKVQPALGKILLPLGLVPCVARFYGTNCICNKSGRQGLFAYAFDSRPDIVGKDICDAIGYATVGLVKEVVQSHRPEKKGAQTFSHEGGLYAVDGVPARLHLAQRR